MQLSAVTHVLLTNLRVFWAQVVVAVSVVRVSAAEACRRVHSSVVRVADCRSAGPWFKSGCALLADCKLRPTSESVRVLTPASSRRPAKNPATRNRTRDHLIAACSTVRCSAK